MRTLLLGALAALVLLAACTSSRDDTGGTTSTTPSPQAQQNSPEAPSTTAIASLDDQELDDTQRTCVEQQLDPDVDPDQIPTDQLDEATAACLRGGTFAQGFVEALTQDHPGLYSDGDLACLADRYGQLTDENLQTLVRAGLDPQNPPPEADQILNDLFGACGVARPPQ